MPLTWEVLQLELPPREKLQRKLTTLEVLQRELPSWEELEWIHGLERNQSTAPEYLPKMATIPDSLPKIASPEPLHKTVSTVIDRARVKRLIQGNAEWNIMILQLKRQERVTTDDVLDCLSVNKW